jgi:hypothetical protein
VSVWQAISRRYIDSLSAEAGLTLVVEPCAQLEVESDVWRGRAEKKPERAMLRLFLSKLEIFVADANDVVTKALLPLLTLSLSFDLKCLLLLAGKPRDGCCMFQAMSWKCIWIVQRQ